MLTAADLIAPKGEIEKSLFPGEDAASLELRLQSYLDEAYLKLDALTTLPPSVDVDEAARSFAYYRSYNAVFLNMSRQAATASIDGEASRSFLATQIATFGRLRDDALAAWNDVLALADVDVEIKRPIDAPHGTAMIIPIW